MTDILLQISEALLSSSEARRDEALDSAYVAIERLRTKVHDLEAADRDHLAAKNGMEKRLTAEIEKWHRVAMEAGAVTCQGGGHIYPLRDRVKKLEQALRDVMNASNCPYEVAMAALSPSELKTP